MSVSTTTELPYCVVSEKQIVELWPTITLFNINKYIGIVCICPVILNFTVLMSSKKLRQQYQVVIILCIAEMFAQLGIILEATTRNPLFLEAISAKKAKKMSSVQCLQPWVLCQFIGDFWCPSLELLMGLERMCAVVFPHTFRRIFAQNNTKFVFLISLIASLFVIVPTTLTIAFPREDVRWSCGRKAAFGSNVGLIDYCYNVIGFTLAFTFNVIAMLYSTNLKQTSLNSTKLKCYTGISLLSTLLVSIPNVFSILNVFMTVSSLLMTPAPMLACANGAIQFFVYLTLNAEYRRHFLKLITFNRIKVIRVKTILNLQQPSRSTIGVISSRK